MSKLGATFIENVCYICVSPLNPGHGLFIPGTNQHKYKNEYYLRH